MKPVSSHTPGAAAGYGAQSHVLRLAEEHTAPTSLLSRHISGKVLGGEGPALVGELDVLRSIHQLPHIAGPAVGLQELRDLRT